MRDVMEGDGPHRRRILADPGGRTARPPKIPIMLIFPKSDFFVLY
jgi:hypothetical protein